MFIVGVYDDFYDANFKLKFFLQIIVAKILIDQGYVISNFHGFLGLYNVPWLFAQISTVFVLQVRIVFIASASTKFKITKSICQLES